MQMLTDHTACVLLITSPVSNLPHRVITDRLLDFTSAEGLIDHGFYAEHQRGR